MTMKRKKLFQKAAHPAKYTLLAMTIGLIVFNQVSILALQDKATMPMQEVQKKDANGKPMFSYSSGGDPVQSAIDAVFPTGTPEWSDGSVSYDNVVKSLGILANVDRAIPVDSLSPELKERYIAVTTVISCEYCCGAKAIAFPNGQAACGCAHSYAMRGVAKFLLTQFGDSYSNEEILFEMTKWKNLFFPKNTVQKAAALIANGMDITPDALNDRQLLQKIQSGDTSQIGQLQGMVGGC